MNVLITSAVSAQAHRLKSRLIADNVILGDYHELPGFMLSAGKMLKLPDPKSITYTHEMLTLSLDKAIDVIYLLDNIEAALLMESKQLFTEYNVDIRSGDEI